MKEPETRARVLMVNIRTRFIDQRMQDAVTAGAMQVVILGAVSTAGRIGFGRPSRT